MTDYRYWIVYRSADGTVKIRGPYKTSDSARAHVPSGIASRRELWTMARSDQPRAKVLAANRQVGSV